MGVVYAVIPVDASVRAWLMKAGLEEMNALACGRAPTPREIRTALAQAAIQSDWRHTSAVGVSAELKSRQGATTTLRLRTFSGDDRPCDFYFSKGSEALIHAAVAAISTLVGPLLLYPDTGGGIVVFNGMSQLVLAEDLMYR